jgi:hypothetical protein
MQRRSVKQGSTTPSLAYINEKYLGHILRTDMKTAGVPMITAIHNTRFSHIKSSGKYLIQKPHTLARL